MWTRDAGDNRCPVWGTGRRRQSRTDGRRDTSQQVVWEDHPRNELSCVEWDGTRLGHSQWNEADVFTSCWTKMVPCPTSNSVWSTLMSAVCCRDWPCFSTSISIVSASATPSSISTDPCASTRQNSSANQPRCSSCEFFGQRTN